MGIVLVHIESDQLADAGHGVERVQIQPLVFQHAPPGFDQRIREADLRLRENTPEQSRVYKPIDGGVIVLDTPIDQNQGLARSQIAR